MQKQGHRVSRIVVEGDLVGGVARTIGKEGMQEGMGQKTAGDRGAYSILRPCDV